MDNTFSGKVALITGGSSGIGLAAARELAARGAHVCLVARNLDRLETAADSVRAAQSYRGQTTCYFPADVSDEAQASQLVEKVAAACGIPDILINSAGIVEPGYVQDLSTQDFRRTMEINFLGTVFVTQALLPGMISRRSGHIVNISSAAGFLAVFGYSAYSASKFAVRGYSDVLRLELKPYGVQVSIVYPGDTDTPQLAYDRAKQPPETRYINSTASTLPPEKVAKLFLKGVARGKYVILPGFEMNLIYRLVSLLGDGVHPILDWLVARSRKGYQAKPRNQAG